jgi:hypothetical protein
MIKRAFGRFQPLNDQIDRDRARAEPARKFPASGEKVLVVERSSAHRFKLYGLD